MSEILVQSLELLVLGMGFVFVFLMVLVWATSTMSSLVMKHLPEPVPQAAAPRRAAPQPKNQIDSTTMAVIAAALKQHRSRQKK